MKFFVLMITLFLQFSVFAQDAVIAVGQAEQEKDKLVIDDPEMKGLSGDQKRLSLELIDILKNDFSFYRHKFNNVEYTDKGKNSFSSPDLAKWHSGGVTYFIASEMSSSAGGIEAKFKVWSVLGKNQIFSQDFKVEAGTLRSSAHRIADSLYRSITGKPSIFNSKIFFLSDRTSKKDIEKELYIMDFDGRRVDKLTNFNSVVLSPSISQDNTQILFSVIASKRVVSRNKVNIIKNIDLKVFDLTTKKFDTLSDRPGINSGAIFGGTPDIVYLTLTFSGNADIYELNIKTKKMRKVTSHYSDDVDPSLNRDGTLMTFLSNRPGKAHIYTMDPRETEKNVKRISFVGKFNATPRFSPEGKEIVFSSWVDGSFDLYRIGSDGNNLVRLTKDFGSNEEPAYSPDGEFIIFTSKRVISKGKAVQDVYIMNREGEILGQLTKDFGRTFSPKWTNI